MVDTWGIKCGIQKSKVSTTPGKCNDMPWLTTVHPECTIVLIQLINWKGHEYQSPKVWMPSNQHSDLCYAPNHGEKFCGGPMMTLLMVYQVTMIDYKLRTTLNQNSPLEHSSGNLKILKNLKIRALKTIDQLNNSMQMSSWYSQHKNELLSITILKLEMSSSKKSSLLRVSHGDEV